MIEKKTMFYVSEGFFEPEEVTAFVDESGRILYAGDEELCKVNDDEQKFYFSTMDAAKSFVDERRSQARESLPFLNGYLSYLNYEAGSYSDEWMAVKSKYRNVFCGLAKESAEWYDKHECAIMAILALKDGQVEVNNETIALSHIQSVRYDRKMAFVTYGNKTISTQKEKEIRILKHIF